jgi:hypothetical protein
MIWVLVNKVPYLTISAIRLVRVDVLELNEFISVDIHGTDGQVVCDFLGFYVVFESLIVETFPVVNNHVFVVSFEESTSWKTNRFDTFFFVVVNPLLH